MAKESLCKQHYIELFEESQKILTESFSEDNEKRMNISHSCIHDYEIYLKTLKERPEIAVYEAALCEYQFSLLALAAGYYRHAYSGLRYMLEMTLAGVSFSANEYHLRQWMNSERDVNWSSINDKGDGVLSKNFFRAFCPELVDEVPHYQALAASAYRELSEYVHGNVNTHEYLPSNFVYNEEVFNQWHVKAKSVRIILLFALTGRYFRHISDKEDSNLTELLLSEFSHIEGVRILLGAPAKD